MAKLAQRYIFSHAFITLLYLTLLISWTRSCRRLTSRSQHRSFQNRSCNAPRRMSSSSRTRPKAIANASWAVLLRSTFPLRWPSCHPPSQLLPCDAANGAELPVAVDADTNLFCSPTPASDPYGCAQAVRALVAPAIGDRARPSGGCRSDLRLRMPLGSTPRTGGVFAAHGMGQAVMMSWGKGGIRVYEE